MRYWLLPSLTGLLIGCLAGQAAELSAPAGRGRPTLDGKLDDACWRGARWQSGFFTNETARPALNKTRFAVCSDGQGLYLAIECPQATPPVVSPQGAAEETAVYRGDVAEVFLQPGGDNRVYYHFAADAAGNRYEAKVFEEGGSLSEDANWGACWQAAGARTSNGWALECAIPWDALPLVPETQREWRLNVGRENVSEPREIVSWCRGEFARRESFGRLTGLSPDLSRYQISVGQATVRRQYTLSGTEVAYVVDLANPLPQPIAAEARLTEGSPQGRLLGERALNLPPGKSALLSLPLLAAPSPGTSLCLQLRDSGGGPRATRLSRVGGQQLSPLRLKLTCPAFRHTVYPTEKVTQFEGVISVAATPEVLAKSKLTALVTKGTLPISRQTIQPVKGVNAMVLPVEALAEGTYRLHVSLEIAGQERETLMQPIAKVAPGPTEVRVDARGRLVRAGKPFFPLLIYATDMSPEGLRELKAAGFTVAHTYYMGYYYLPEKCLETFGPILDTAAQEGMPVLDYALANKNYGTREYFAPRWLPQAIPGIQRQISDFRDKPALLFWGIGEEFHSTGEDQAKGLQAVYETICNSDPYRPAYVGDYSPDCLALEMRSADVGIIWSYPDFYRAGGSRVALDQLASRLEQLWRLMDGGYRSKPIIGMPQLFNFGSNYPQGFAARRAPNHFEMRSMTYQALIHGAAGIGYYDASGHQGWPGAWTAVKYLGRELSLLTPVLLEPMPGPSSRSLRASSTSCASSTAATGTSSPSLAVTSRRPCASPARACGPSKSPGRAERSVSRAGSSRTSSGPMRPASTPPASRPGTCRRSRTSRPGVSRRMRTRQSAKETTSPVSPRARTSRPRARLPTSHKPTMAGTERAGRT